MQPEFEIWLDNQLPPILAKWMTETFGWQVKSSFILQVKEASDWEIYRRAKSYPVMVILLSKDGDFPKIILQNGSPPKLIKLNIGNLPNRQLWDVLQPILHSAVKTLLNSEATTIIIESDHN